MPTLNIHLTRGRAARILLAAILPLLLITGCEMEELPKSQAGKKSVFGSANGLELYSNSFYDMLPGNSDGVYRADELSDLVSVQTIDNYLVPGFLTPSTSGGWSWSNLRNINYFIENTESSDTEGKEYYLGIAHFFRAYFYFDKVKRFGDVPIVLKTIPIDDEKTLYGKRDSRFDVMEQVLKDLDYAIEHISVKSEPSRTRITRDVVLAFKTRVCLYEASFRKYHTEYDKQSTAVEWYRRVIQAADQLSGYSLRQGPNAYRDLFMQQDPSGEETILAVAMSEKLGVFNARNRRTVSPTYGNRPSLSKHFVNMYLNADGSRFTDRKGYNEIEFAEETAHRDPRLLQTIRSIDYQRTRNGVPEVAPPNFTEAFTGYEIIKGLYDEILPYDDETRNLNAHLIIRYPEVLLNKAEALAELGEMTPQLWQQTIGVIRSRAGLTGPAVTDLPTVADPYLVKYYRDRFTDPVLLEVIRERAVELILEGFRTDDLKRWRLGELFEKEFMGVYVPALGEYDLNGDGKPEVLFYQQGTDPEGSTATTKIDVTAPGAGRFYLTDGTSGNLIWNPGERKWEDKLYFYPIPEGNLIENDNLGQNPGY